MVLASIEQEIDMREDTPHEVTMIVLAIAAVLAAGIAVLLYLGW
jgi:hypothetical protein